MSNNPKILVPSRSERAASPIAHERLPARRELLRGSLGALGSFWVLNNLPACSRNDGVGALSGASAAAVGGGAAGASAALPSTAGAASGAGARASIATAGSVGLPPIAAGLGNAGHATNTAGTTAMDDTDAGLPVQPDTSMAPMAGPLVACATVTRFANITDDGPRSGFTRMDQGNALEWLTTGLSASLYATQLPDCVLFMLRALDGIQLGYPLSMLAHSLQAATRARRANASDELVLCALCHHLGVLITNEGQAELSASILRGFVSEPAYHVVRHQTEYLWAHYGDRIGQPTQQRARYVGQSWHAQAVTFSDEWDGPSYDPSYTSLTLADFEPLVRGKFGPDSGYLVGQLTSTDCIMKGS